MESALTEANFPHHTKKPTRQRYGVSVTTPNQITVHVLLGCISEGLISCAKGKPR